MVDGLITHTLKRSRETSKVARRPPARSDGLGGTCSVGVALDGVAVNVGAGVGPEVGVGVDVVEQAATSTTLTHSKKNGLVSSLMATILLNKQ